MNNWTRMGNGDGDISTPVFIGLLAYMTIGSMAETHSWLWLIPAISLGCLFVFPVMATQNPARKLVSIARGAILAIVLGVIFASKLEWLSIRVGSLALFWLGGMCAGLAIARAALAIRARLSPPLSPSRKFPSE